MTDTDIMAEWWGHYYSDPKHANETEFETDDFDLDALMNATTDEWETLLDYKNTSDGR